MRNLLFTIRYDGGGYHGFQVQRGLPTVCGAFQTAFHKLTGEWGEWKGCSRTDAGVHADMFCLSVKTNSEIPCDAMVRAMNARLEREIAVYGCIEAPDRFHARYSRVAKRYVYQIYNARERNPFVERYALHYPYPIDAEQLDRAVKPICGRHDFTSFCATGSNQKEMVRTLYDAGVVRQGEMVSFYIAGDGFLYNMVRIVAGTLLYMAKGKLEYDSMEGIIRAADRARAGITLPPHGLRLDRVYYLLDGFRPPEHWNAREKSACPVREEPCV